MKRRKEINAISMKSKVLIYLFFILFALVCIVPIFLILSVSFSDENKLLLHGYKFIPLKFSTYAYERLFADSYLIFNAYGVTIFSTIVGSISNVFIMTLYAYPLSRVDFPFKKFFSTYVLITMLISGGLVASYIVNITILKIKNTMMALILPTMGAGYHIFIMRTYFKDAIPLELVDAAKIDGAGEFGTFIKIIIPIVKPIVAAMLMYNVLAYWNEWRSSLYYITNPKLYTLQYIMQQALLNMAFVQQNLADSTMGLDEALKALPIQSVRMAMVIVGIGPVIIAYPFLQKYFIQGLTAGSAKG